MPSESPPAKPPVVARNPKEEIEEILNFFAFARKPDAKYVGTAVFEFSKSDVNPAYTIAIRCLPDGSVQTWHGLPPDGKVNVHIDCSRDDFFYIYSGAAGPGAIASMCLTGRVRVRWLRFKELQGFAQSFDYSTPTWISFYRRHAQHAQADALMRKQWETAAAANHLVDEEGNIIENVAALPPERQAKLQKLGSLWRKGYSFNEVTTATDFTDTLPTHPVVREEAGAALPAAPSTEPSGEAPAAVAPPPTPEAGAVATGEAGGGTTAAGAPVDITPAPTPTPTPTPAPVPGAATAGAEGAASGSAGGRLLVLDVLAQEGGAPPAASAAPPPAAAQGTGSRTDAAVAAAVMSEGALLPVEVERAADAAVVPSAPAASSQALSAQPPPAAAAPMGAEGTAAAATAAASDAIDTEADFVLLLPDLLAQGAPPASLLASAPNVASPHSEADADAWACATFEPLTAQLHRLHGAGEAPRAGDWLTSDSCAALTQWPRAIVESLPASASLLQYGAAAPALAAAPHAGQAPESTTTPPAALAPSTDVDAPPSPPAAAPALMRADTALPSAGSGGGTPSAAASSSLLGSLGGSLGGIVSAVGSSISSVFFADGGSDASAGGGAPLPLPDAPPLGAPVDDTPPPGAQLAGAGVMRAVHAVLAAHSAGLLAAALADSRHAAPFSWTHTAHIDALTVRSAVSQGVTLEGAPVGSLLMRLLQHNSAARDIFMNVLSGACIAPRAHDAHRVDVFRFPRIPLLHQPSATGAAATAALSPNAPPLPQGGEEGEAVGVEAARLPPPLAAAVKSAACRPLPALRAAFDVLQPFVSLQFGEAQDSAALLRALTAQVLQNTIPGAPPDLLASLMPALPPSPAATEAAAPLVSAAGEPATTGHGDEAAVAAAAGASSTAPPLPPPVQLPRIDPDLLRVAPEFVPFATSWRAPDASARSSAPLVTMRAAARGSAPAASALPAPPESLASSAARGSDMAAEADLVSQTRELRRRLHQLFGGRDASSAAGARPLRVGVPHPLLPPPIDATCVWLPSALGGGAEERDSARAREYQELQRVSDRQQRQRAFAERAQCASPSGSAQPGDAAASMPLLPAWALLPVLSPWRNTQARLQGSTQAGAAALPRLQLSALAAAQLRAARAYRRAAGVSVPILDRAQSETLAWCIGARPLHQYGHAPVTLGAVHIAVPPPPQAPLPPAAPADAQTPPAPPAADAGDANATAGAQLPATGLPSATTTAAAAAAAAASSDVPSGASAPGVEEAVYLMPVWHPRRLMLGKCSAATEEAARSELGLVSSSGVHAHRMPSIYNSLGSDVFFRNACERLRIQLEDAVAAAGGAASPKSSGGALGAPAPPTAPAAPAAQRDSSPVIVNIGPANARIQVALPRGPSLEDELRMVYDNVDDSMQVAGLPRSRMFDIITPSRLRNVAAQLQERKAVKAYPLADDDAPSAAAAQVQQQPPQQSAQRARAEAATPAGGGAGAARAHPLAGAFTRDTLSRVRQRILGSPAPAVPPAPSGSGEARRAGREEAGEERAP